MGFPGGSSQLRRWRHSRTWGGTPVPLGHHADLHVSVLFYSSEDESELLLQSPLFETTTGCLLQSPPFEPVAGYFTETKREGKKYRRVQLLWKVCAVTTIMNRSGAGPGPGLRKLSHTAGHRAERNHFKLSGDFSLGYFSNIWSALFNTFKNKHATTSALFEKKSASSSFILVETLCEWWGTIKRIIFKADEILDDLKICCTIFYTIHNMPGYT